MVLGPRKWTGSTDVSPRVLPLTHELTRPPHAGVPSTPAPTLPPPGLGAVPAFGEMTEVFSALTQGA